MNATDPTVDDAIRWTSADDSVHTPATDHYDWTETTWWSFAVPERALFGWLYCQMRPNNGTVAGGAFVYDDKGALPWELPYYAYSHYSRLPELLTEGVGESFAAFCGDEFANRLLGEQTLAAG